MGSVVDFNPLSTDPAGLQPKIFILGCNLPVTTRQILTRLNILGCYPPRAATRWKWVEFKKSKIGVYRSFVNQNSTRLKFRVTTYSGCNPW
jgi:hypothetical protein